MICFFRQFHAANEIVDDFDFLTSLSLCVNLYFVNKDFFDEGIEKGWRQFLKRSVLFDQLHKAIDIDGPVCLLSDLLGKLLDGFLQALLLGFITG